MQQPIRKVVGRPLTMSRHLTNLENLAGFLKKLCAFAPLRRCVKSLLPGSDLVWMGGLQNDVPQRGRRAETRGRRKLFHVGFAPTHVVETRCVCFRIRHEFNF